MEPTFSIEVEPAGFMRFTLAGMFDAETAQRLAAERAKAFTRLRCPPNAHVKLIDASRLNLQSQTIATMLQHMMSDPTTRSRRLAFVADGALLRMQIKRMVGARPDVGFFSDVFSAERWLREALVAPPAPMA